MQAPREGARMDVGGHWGESGVRMSLLGSFHLGPGGKEGLPWSFSIPGPSAEGGRGGMWLTLPRPRA